jgi:hypothetical protein
MKKKDNATIEFGIIMFFVMMILLIVSVIFTTYYLNLTDVCLRGVTG